MNPILHLLRDVYHYVKEQFDEVVTLKEGTDMEGTVEAIRNGIEIRGSNVWILVGAAMLASIGLDVNSTAVIIGAMLISPLMSPILGVGLAVGISDREMLFTSMKNLVIATLASLITSSLYFTFTPLGQPTTEMLARTTPTLLDVGVATFGGVAGIVATSRKDKAQAIPGVAIATALMPPLCTAGYGLAKGSPQFFFGAFYLFFINAVFISLSTYLIVRYLKFPYIKFVDKATKIRIQRWLTVIVTIVIIPSGIILWQVVQKARTDRSINVFIERMVNTPNYEAIRWEIDKQDTVEYLKLFVIGEPIPDDEIEKITKAQANYNLQDFTLRLIQMNVPESERMRLKSEVAGEVAMSVLKQLQITQEAQLSKQRMLDSLRELISGIQITPDFANIVKKEATIAFPEIEILTFGTVSEILSDSLVKVTPTVNFRYPRNLSRAERLRIEGRLTEYLKIRFEQDSIILNVAR